MSELRISPDNTLLIPAEQLLELGIKPGDMVRVVVSDATLVLSKQTVQPPELSLQQSIARKNLQTGIQFIKGVGPKLSELLAKRDIHSVEDALFC